MAASHVNIATAVFTVQVFLFCFTRLSPVAAKRERLDHGAYLELSDLISNIEKRLNDPNLFDKSLDPTGNRKNAKLIPLSDKNRIRSCENKVTKASIIRATESLDSGANFLDSFKGTDSNVKCQEYCCKNSSCDVAVYQDKGDRYCYLFKCEGKCRFKEHAGYLVNGVTHDSSSGSDSEDTSGSENDLENLSGGRTGDSSSAGTDAKSHGQSGDVDSGGTEGSSSPGEPQGGQVSASAEAPQGPMISQHSVSLSGYCTQDNQCEDTNAACSSNNCKCRSGFYNKEGLCRKVCPPSKFECFELGTISRGPECVPKTQVCDSYMQCADGSDEFNCEAAYGEQGRGWPQQYPGGYNSGRAGPFSQLLPPQPPTANLLPQQQQQQQQPLAMSKSPSQGSFGQQQAGVVFPKQSQQQINKVGLNSGGQQPLASSSSSTGMSGVRTNSAQPVALPNSNTLASSGNQMLEQSPQEANTNANQNARPDKLTPIYPNSMQTNNKPLPYPTNPNNYQQQTGHVANAPPPLPIQQNANSQAQVPPANSGLNSRVGTPVTGQRILPPNQIPRVSQNKSGGPNGPSAHSNIAGDTAYRKPGSGFSSQQNIEGASKDNMVMPGALSKSGPTYAVPQTSLSQKASAPSQNGGLQSSQPRLQSVVPGQAGNQVASSAGQKSSLGKTGGDSLPGAGTVGQGPSGKLATHVLPAQQHSQEVKTNKNAKQHQGGREPDRDYNSQQWVEPGAYLPYGYGNSGASNSRNQQQGMGSGNYFDPVSSRFYPGGGYGQMPSSGYRQDSIPSSFFGNTASADDFSQYGGQYLSQGKSLGGNNYLSGRYPDMAGYNGSPVASSSSQYLQPPSGGNGRTYDFDGEYRSPQSYQDLDFYSPMTGQQNLKSSSQSQPSYKANSGYKSAYGTRPGLYEEFPSDPVHGKSKSDGKETGQSSIPKPDYVKNSKPTPMALNKPSAVPTKDAETAGHQNAKSSASKPSVGEKSVTSTQKPVSGINPSVGHKLETGNGGAKHLFVASSREKVIIASPGGGNAEGPIVALSLGLALTLVLLVMVACRLRGFKHRLSKGRPLNQNEADYLINGMYL